MRTPAQALAYAANVLNQGYNGYCLAHVQDSYGANAVDPTAIAAWRNSPTKHAGYPTIPGLPIYFSGGNTPYGHVALWAGPDTMYTTDSGVGHPHYDSISKWINQYGYTYLGYTLDIERQPIPGLVDLGDEVMAISDDDAKKIAAAVWTYAWPKAPPSGGNMYNMMADILKAIKSTPGAVWTYAWKDGKTGLGLPDGGNMYNAIGNLSARVKGLFDRLVK